MVSQDQNEWSGTPEPVFSDMWAENNSRLVSLNYRWLRFTYWTPETSPVFQAATPSPLI